jgi:hypothetical protein
MDASRGARTGIYRDDPHDPDDESTLATARFEIGSASVSMKAYRQGHCVFDTFIDIPKPATSAAIPRN